MTWNSQSSYIWIFPVGRGSAAFIRTALNHGFILDMAGGDCIDPAAFVREHFVPHLTKYRGADAEFAIAQAVLSHPHMDHIAQCGELVDDLSPALLTCPHDNDADGGTNEKIDWSRIENEDNTKLLTAYRELYAGRRPPLQTICHESRHSVPNLGYGIYYVRPPACSKLHPSNDQHYANATSIVLYYRHGAHSILFPGDVTPEAMRSILNDDETVEKRFTEFDMSSATANPNWHVETSDQPSLRSVLGGNGLSVLVAPHHGLESCYSPELFGAIRGGKPDLVALSERRKKHRSDGKCHPRYQAESGASGLSVEYEGVLTTKRSVSTVDGKHILITFSGNGRPRVAVYEDPTKLLSKIT